MGGVVEDEVGSRESGDTIKSLWTELSVNLLYLALILIRWYQSQICAQLIIQIIAIILKIIAGVHKIRLYFSVKMLPKY